MEASCSSTYKISGPLSHGFCKRQGGLTWPKVRAREFRRGIKSGVFSALFPEVIQQLSHAAEHLPLAYERVVLPCSAMNCGDIIHRR